MLEQDKSEWEEYMDEFHDGLKMTNREMFYYPYEDVSKERVNFYISEQADIKKEQVGLCQYCGKNVMRELSFYDYEGRRHVYMNCSNCRNYLGTITNVPNIDNRMPFGKHKGMSMKKIQSEHPQYIKWFIDNFNGDPKMSNIRRAMIIAVYEKETRYKHKSYQVPPQSFIDMMYNKYCK